MPWNCGEGLTRAFRDLTEARSYGPDELLISGTEVFVNNAIGFA